MSVALGHLRPASVHPAALLLTATTVSLCLISPVSESAAPRPKLSAGVNPANGSDRSHLNYFPVLVFVMRRTIGSAWLSQTLQRSTTSLIGVSGGTLSKCRRKSQLSCPAINLSRISRSRPVCPISPNAFTANVSNAVAKITGSSPTFLVVR